MADVSRFYDALGPMPTRNADGSLSATPIPQTVDQMYEGIYARPSPGYGQLIQNVEAQNLTTRSVPTYPVNASNWDNPAGIETGARQPIQPPREVWVPSTGVPLGNGPWEMGYVPGGAYRLVPDTPAAAATQTAAKAPAYIGRPHMATYTRPFSAPAGLTAADKAANAARAAALLQSVPLPRGVTRQQLVQGNARIAPQTALPTASAVAQALARPAAPAPGTVRQGTNGYIYTADGRGGWVQTGRVNAGLTPAQQYSQANSGASRPAGGSTNPSIMAAQSGGGGETPYVNERGEASWTSAW